MIPPDAKESMDRSKIGLKGKLILRSMSDMVHHPPAMFGPPFGLLIALEWLCGPNQKCLCSEYSGIGLDDNDEETTELEPVPHFQELWTR